MIPAKNLGQKVSASCVKALAVVLQTYAYLAFFIQFWEGIDMLILILDSMIFSSKPLKYM